MHTLPKQSSSPMRAVIIVGMYLLLSLLWLLIFSENTQVLKAGHNTFQIIAPLLASIWLFAKYKNSKGKFRKIWLFPCAANISYVIAMLCYMYYDYYLKVTAPSPGVPDFFWLLMNSLYLFTFIFFVYLNGKTYRAIQLLFDILIVMVVASTLSWEFLIKDILFSSSDHGFFYKLVYIGYPVSDLAILFGILMIYYLNTDYFSQKSLLFMFSGMLIFLVGDSFYLYLVSEGIYELGNPVDVSWTSGMLLFALATFDWKKAQNNEQPLHNKEESDEPIGIKANHFFSIRLWLPYISIAFLVMFIIIEGSGNNSFVVGLIISALLVIMRQVMTLVENNLLLLKSGESNKQLELQVNQRTEELNQKNRELEESIKKAEYFAYHDVLTGLPNRRYFELTLQRWLSKSDSKDHIAVLFLDLDRFKLINDTLSHAVGDLLLRQVAERLKKIVDNEGLISRQGGDEFLLLLYGSTKEAAVTMADKIVKGLSETFHIGEHEVYITSSIGISHSPEHGEDIEMLIKRADTALYAVKDAGKNNFQMFTQELDNELNSRANVESGLRTAIERDEFLIHYQPRWDKESEEIQGMEALLRWKHPVMGMVSPADFIPIAEEIGIIHKIGIWVLEEATRQTLEWHKNGLPPLQISVNVSAVQFLQIDFYEQIINVLKKTKLDPIYLELEVTESIMHQSEDAINVLEKLRSIGIKISLDDFGSGYSSLNQIGNIPLDILKIDKAFVDHIVSNKKSQAIVTTILALGKNLGLRIVAEGVEHEDQLTYLLDSGCDEIQGYVISPPLASNEFETFMKTTVGRN